MYRRKANFVECVQVESKTRISEGKWPIVLYTQVMLIQAQLPSQGRTTHSMLLTGEFSLPYSLSFPLVQQWNLQSLIIRVEDCLSMKPIGWKKTSFTVSWRSRLLRHAMISLWQDESDRQRPDFSQELDGQYSWTSNPPLLKVCTFIPAMLNGRMIRNGPPISQKHERELHPSFTD